MLVSVCRWLFRLTIVLAAAALLAVASAIRGTSTGAAAILCAGAAVLLISETVHSTLKRLEKK